MTGKDLEKSSFFLMLLKIRMSRLLVAAAVGVGKEGVKRSEALIEAGCDIIINWPCSWSF